MGSTITGLAQVYSKHKLDKERIKNMHDEKEQELEINRIIAENNYQISCQEIMRLIKLDENNFKIALEKIIVEKRKNDQLHEREMKRINNENEAKMKSLHNEEQKISNEYKLATRKLDDDKEINNIRENNSFINEKNKMKLDFEVQMKHMENEEFDIVNKRRNEKLKDQQNFANEKMKLVLNHEINMEEISRKRKKDENENNRLTQKLVLENSREKEKNQNDFLIK